MALFNLTNFAKDLANKALSFIAPKKEEEKKPSLMNIAKSFASNALNVIAPPIGQAITGLRLATKPEIKPEPKAIFKVGEGLSPEQQKKAKEVVRKPAPQKVIFSPLKSLAEKVSDPYAVSALEKLAYGKPELLTEEEQKSFSTLATPDIAGITKITKGKKIIKEIVEEITEKLPIKQPKQILTQLEKERGFISSIKKEFPEMEKVAGQYIPRSTDELAIKAKNLIKDNIIEAERVAMTRADDNAVAVASELLKHYNDEAIKITDIATKNALYDQAAVVANDMAHKLTEAGRSVQAASILGRLTPEGQVRFAAKEILNWNAKHPDKQLSKLTGEQTQFILNKMKSIDGLPYGLEKAQQFQELQKYIKNLIPSTLIQKMVAVWKAGLLTGMKTTGLNIFANVSHTGTEIIKDIPAAASDYLLSLFTGKRTKTFTLGGLPIGIKEGTKRGWMYLKTGFDERNIAQKLDYKQVNFKNKIVQNYVDGVFKILGAEDQPFYYGALKRSLYDQAVASVKNKRLIGLEKETFIKQYITNPTNEMMAYAIMDAETAVFQNQTALGKAARAFQKIPAVGEFAVPFGRTPSAVAMQTINYTPVGIFIEIGKQIKNKKFDQRLLSQAIGRGVIGAGVLWIGGKLLNNKMLTLDYPKNERERELWKLEGKKPNTILINGKWRTVQTLGPVGVALLIGGHFERARKETGSATNAMVQAVFGTIKSFTEQTFLKGVNDIMGAITDPQRNAEYVASSFLSSFIPTIINDVARASDPKERRAENVLQRIQSRIPILRQKLEPQISVLGEESKRIGNPLEVMLDPTRPSKEISTPLTKELRRLWDAGFQVSPTVLGDKRGYKILTQKQNTILWKKAGEIINSKLSNLIRSEQYQILDDERKSKVVEDFVNQSKINARAALILELTAGLENNDLRNKLSELKAGGVMTRDVFNKWQEIR